VTAFGEPIKVSAPSGTTELNKVIGDGKLGRPGVIDLIVEANTTTDTHAGRLWHLRVSADSSATTTRGGSGGSAPVVDRGAPTGGSGGSAPGVDRGATTGGSGGPAPVVDRGAPKLPDALPLSKAEYVREMTLIGHQLSSSINSLSTITNSKSGVRTAGKVRDHLREAIGRLAAISPPTDIKVQHEHLTQAVKDFAAELDPIIEKLSGGNLAALSTLRTLKGLKEIRDASLQIVEAGYRIDG
jgi:hypothetical protein